MFRARATLARSVTWAAAAILLAGAAGAAGETQKVKKTAKPAAAKAAPAVAAPAVVAAPAAAGAVAAGASAGKPVNAPPTPGELALKRGIAAYQAGKMANAVGSLSSAMSKGGLSGPNLARALYYRGLAYRKQGKPAQAIPDLTNALFLPNGLDAAERADATSSRAAAYREAGIADAGGAPAPAAAVSPPADAAPVSSAPASPAWQTAAAPAVAPSSAVALNAVPAAEPAAPASGSGVGSFFSNLFGGSSSTAPAASGPASDVTTASTGQSPAAAVPASAAVSSWSSGTEVSAKVAKGQRTAAASPAAPVVADTPAASPVAAKTKPASGKYKLQVAAVRSRSEAESLAARVAGEHGGKLGDRKPVIEEAVFGNMGTFYRVNVGPYASAGEPDAVCKSLRASGFDCLVVTH